MNKKNNKVAVATTKEINPATAGETFLQKIEQSIEELKPLYTEAEIQRKYWEKKFKESRKMSQKSWGNGEYWSQAEKFNILSDKLKNSLNNLWDIKTTIAGFERNDGLLSSSDIKAIKKGVV